MKFVLALLIILLASPALAQTATSDTPPGTATPPGNAGLQQLLPSLLGLQQHNTSPPMQQSGIAAPQPPTAPIVRAVHMGGSGEQGGVPGLPGGLGAIIPGLRQQQQATDSIPLTARPPALIEPGARDADFSEMRVADTVTVAQVLDPVRIRLKDGRILQLAGIDSADYDPYDPGPVSIAARDYLKPLLEGQQVRLHITKDATNGRITRLGDELVQLEMPHNGVWVQGVLLANGLARVRPSERNPEMASQMIRLEDGARAAHKGLWADPRYTVLTPQTAGQALNSWGIVTGRVYNVGTNRNIIYLNFGPDFRKDFTVGISSDVRRALEAKGINPLMLTGRSVRVRGWLRLYNGPFMDLGNAAWLEPQVDTNTRMP